MRYLSAIVGMIVVFAVVAEAAEDPKVAGACMTCHKEKSPGLYKQWYDSNTPRTTSPV